MNVLIIEDEDKLAHYLATGMAGLSTGASRTASSRPSGSASHCSAARMRAFGFPRMVLAGDEMVIAWTAPGAGGSSGSASITISDEFGDRDLVRIRPGLTVLTFPR